MQLPSPRSIVLDFQRSAQILSDSRTKPVPTGMYIQFPLMLAWAVTIRKSQGKTLDRVRVDLGRGAFTSGQV